MPDAPKAAAAGAEKNEDADSHPYALAVTPLRSDCQLVNVTWKAPANVKMKGYGLYRDNHLLEADPAESGEFEDSNLGSMPMKYVIASKEDPKSRVLDSRFFDPKNCILSGGTAGGGGGGGGGASSTSGSSGGGGAGGKSGKKGGGKGGGKGKGSGSGAAAAQAAGFKPKSKIDTVSGSPAKNAAFQPNAGAAPGSGAPKGAAAAGSKAMAGGNKPSSLKSPPAGPLASKSGGRAPAASPSSKGSKPTGASPAGSKPAAAGAAKRGTPGGSDFPYLGKFWRAFASAKFNAAPSPEGKPQTGKEAPAAPPQNASSAAEAKESAGPVQFHDAASEEHGNPPAAGMLVNRNPPPARSEPQTGLSYLAQLGILAGILLVGPPLYRVITGKKPRR